MKKFLIILLSLMFSSTVVLARTSTRKTDRPLVLEKGTLELSNTLGPLHDSNDSFDSDKMSLSSTGDYSLSDSLSVGGLSLSLPFSDTADAYLVSLAPRAKYQLGSSGGLTTALSAGTLLTEFGGDAAFARDDLENNLKSWFVAGEAEYTLSNFANLAGGLGLQFDDITSANDSHSVVLAAGVDLQLLRRLSAEPRLEATFSKGSDAAYGASVPLFCTLSNSLDLGASLSVHDLENARDTYSVGAVLLWRNQ